MSAQQQAVQENGTKPVIGRERRARRASRALASALVAGLLVTGSACVIKEQALARQASVERLVQIAQQRAEQARVEQQVAEDDGPQDGSSDCWTVAMCGAR